MNEIALTRTFLAVYRTGSVTRAAERLGITQPGASGHLRTLEGRLGKPLFEKRGRSLKPTAAADDLARSVAVHLDAIEATVSAMKVGSRDLAGLVHFGGPAEFLSKVICPQIGAALSQGIRVQMRFGQSREIVAALAEGALDLAVSTLRIRSPAIQYTRLYRERFVLVGLPEVASDLLDDRAPDMLAMEYERRPIVAYAGDLPIIRRFWRDIFSAEIAIEPTLILPDLRSVMDAVAAGLGISVLPTYLCSAAIENGDLAVLVDDGGRCFNDVLLGANRYAVGQRRTAFLRDHLLATVSGSVGLATTEERLLAADPTSSGRSGSR